MGRLEKAYPKLERALRMCHTAGWAVAQAFGLGLLDADALVRLTVRRFESSGYADPSYNTDSGLWLWECEALRRFFPQAGRIIVGAAGSGREMIALHRAGYSVVGFECARTLVDAGAAILEDVECPGQLLWAAPCMVPPLEGLFDGAIMGWSGYMYVPTRAQRVRLLQEFRHVLRPGAPLLLSFQTRELCERRMRWSARGANWIRRIRGVPLVIPGDCLDNGFKHWFNREDIASEMADAELRMEFYSIECYGWAVGTRPVDHDSAVLRLPEIGQPPDP